MHTTSHSSAKTANMRKVGIRSTALFLALLLVFGTCGWFAYSAIVHHQTPMQLITQQGPNTTLTIGSTEALPSLDIQKDTSTALDPILLNNVYETLLSRDQHNNPVAGIAQSWQQSEDGLQYTFQLHNAMQFANGHTLDADDVVWSLQQIMEHQFVGHEQLRNISEVSAPDKHTVHITLSAPNPELLWALTGRAGIVYDSESHIDYTKQVAGSGPFTINHFAAGQPITLSYNAQYWGAKAHVGSIVVKPYADAHQAAQDFLAGSLNALIPVDTEQVSMLQEQAKKLDFTLQQGTSSTKVVLGFNSSPDSLFSDQLLRTGARQSIDKTTLAKTYGDTPLYGPLTTLDPGYEDLSSKFPYDPASARQRLYFFYLSAVKTLVYPDTFGEQIGHTIADQLHQVGFNIDVQMVDTQTWRDRIANNQYDLTLYKLTDSHDYNWYIANGNPLHFTDAQSEELYTRAMQATNQQNYAQALAKYAERLSDASPVDWLYQDSPWIAWHNKVQHLPTAMVSQYLPLRDVTIEE